jgi:hypothetical protein
MESLRLMCVQGFDRLLPHLVHAPRLRSLIFPCDAQNPEVAALYGATHPSRAALHSLLTAAPLLRVRLAVVATQASWCNLSKFWYRYADESQRERVKEQWRELQRLGAEMARVTIVEPILSGF